MARTGIYKVHVKEAREKLLAKGIHPSAEAVRIALGNTGSITTIHKYLKELDSEANADDGVKLPISETIQRLIVQLATQLQQEADSRIEAAHAREMDQENRHAETMAAAKQEIDQLTSSIARAERVLAEEQAAHAATRDALQRETMMRHIAEQHAVDVKDRLAENEAYRQSLEEKHRHAREALEHYRQSVKEQRDQDHRRHEQQIQQLQAELRVVQQTVTVKQEDITRLNQEGSRLVSELSHAQKNLFETENVRRKLEQKLETLHVSEHRVLVLSEQLQKREEHVAAQETQLAAAMEKIDGLSACIRNLERDLTTTQAKLDAQVDINTVLRQYRDTPGSSAHGRVETA